MIHFDCTGPEDGEVLLLSSGLGGSGGYWSANLAALARHYRVVTYDQRGTGRSPAALEPPYAIADMADDAAWVLDALGARACRFIGHALGGLVGLALAARAPGLVSHLVVVNGWMQPDPHTVRCFDVRRDLLLKAGIGPYLRAQPLFLYPSSWMAANATRLATDEAHAAAHFPGVQNTLLRIAALLGFDAAPLLPALACRTLLVVSQDDLLVPPVCSERLHAALLPGSRMARLDGGHACNVTDAAAFAALCLEFLAA
ncbi:pyrimidine utilization protein D [Lichenicoccus sp.]|uniref:pyrimidine utilization protein D n=1 Tax=Lichenicoccus sp. TaxID=2781899 RepID=UPI003D0CBC23